MSQQFYLETRSDRARAVEAVSRATKGLVVEIRPPHRTGKQNRRLHAMFQDVARSGYVYPEDGTGRTRTVAEWKFLFISAHASATGEMGEVLIGLDDERCFLREASSNMTRARLNSLIEYVIAWCNSPDRKTPIRLRDPEEIR